MLNCLKGKGCSGRRDGSRWQIKLCCEYHPCRPSPSSQGSSSIDVHSQNAVTSSRKKEPRQIFTENGSMEGYGIFAINSQNFLQNLSCIYIYIYIYILITDSLRALSRWCSCLMYFIFPRIACSQCEECQLFWETWYQVGERWNYSWGDHEEGGYLLHPHGRQRAQPLFQAQNEKGKVCAPLNLDKALGAEIIGKGTAGPSLEEGGELWQRLRLLPALCSWGLGKNQAHTTISFGFEHPWGHKAGLCLVCRAVSCFKCLPLLPTTAILPFYPLALRFFLMLVGLKVISAF